MQKIRNVNNSSIIELEQVNFSYGERLVLSNINMSVAEGDFLGIVGPNGSGKSTLLKIILGLLEPQSGTVKVDNIPIRLWRDWSRFGYISQQANNFNTGFPATVYEVVSLGIAGKKGLFKRISKEDSKKINETIELVGLQDYRNQLIGKLSGGQQQRVFIAKALVSDPDIMVFDEPTVGVDANSMGSFYQLLDDLHRIQQKTIILVTHDIGAITTKVNRIACLNRELYFHGDNQEFIKRQDEILSRAYRHSIQVIEHAH